MLGVLLVDAYGKKALKNARTCGNGTHVFAGAALELRISSLQNADGIFLDPKCSSLVWSKSKYKDSNSQLAKSLLTDFQHQTHL